MALTPVGPGFGTPVVVDQYRPGYEPDVAVQSLPGTYQGSTFVSMPNGFSTTQSFLWRSDDNRASYHLTEGNALGKSTTCIGGGDTELQLDPVTSKLYFVDLQGLTNFSNSTSTDGGHTFTTTCTGVNGTAVDRQWEGIDSNGGTAGVGTAATDGRIYLDYDNVSQSTSLGNQLVMNESQDGVHFGSNCTGVTPVPGTPVTACPTVPAVISANEDIPGNVVVDNVRGSAYQHRVYASHTGDNGSSVVISACSGKPGDVTAAQVAADCTDPTLNPEGTNPYWKDTYARIPGSYLVGKLFPSISLDAAGNLYAVWAELPNVGGTPSGASSIKMAVSTDGGANFTAPITISSPSLGDTVMPWITTGTPGHVGIAWYGTTTGKDPATGLYGPDGATTAQWNLYYATAPDAVSLSAGRYTANPTPTFASTQVNEVGHPIKYGNISTGGLGGAQDRSLGDYLEVQQGTNGEAVISYVDDTSADRNPDASGGTGETPPEAAGPVMTATQNLGPSLVVGDTVPTQGTHSGVGSTALAFPAALAAKDAFYSSGGTDTPAAANQQVGGVTVSQPDATHLSITLATEDPNLAKDLLVSPTLGGATADWLVRWAAPSYSAPGDGNIWYVGMESTAGGAPAFFTGSTQAITTTHAKYFTYPATTTIPGSINGSTITWTVPLAAVGSPAVGQGLYSITGFTSTQQTPSTTPTTPSPTGGEVGDENIPNYIGTGGPQDLILAAPPTPALPEASFPVLLALVGFGATAVLIRRRRRVQLAA